MARQPRLEFPGALYHVISRGIERRDLFRDDADRSRYLAFLERSVGRFKFKVFAYCLMSNHVHLAIGTGAQPLSRIMRGLNTAYAGYFNGRHRRSGYLFQGRYKAFLVDDEAYLLSLVRYIHENPVKAGIVAAPEGYAWSSHRGYVGRGPKWLSCDEVLERFGRRRASAVRNFKEFFREAEGQPYEEARRFQQVIVGDEVFARHRLEAKGDEPVLRVRRVEPHAVVRWVADRAKVDLASLTGRSQERMLSRMRGVVGLLAPVGGVSVASVARELGRDSSSVWKRAAALAKASESDNQLRLELDRLKRAFTRFVNNA